jgi:hypothetical protein
MASTSHKPVSWWALGSGGALVAAALVACSSSSPQSSAPYSGPPFATATSTSGALEVAVRLSQQPPAPGLLDAELTFTSADGGAPVDGLTLNIVPWMPQMKHGADLTPTVTAETGGKYMVTNLNFIMAGLWELKTAVSGPMTDTVDPEFQVP